jgi:DNA polymerase-3 subunit delta'
MQFKDVLVSPKLKEQLLNQVHEHRISHAQFFLAQPGNHAFALAVALAQYLCCEHPTDTDSCGTCPSCVQFSKLSHPDLHIYFPNCNTKTIKKDSDSILLAPEFKDFVIKNNYHITMQDWLNVLEGENKQPSINIRDCSNIINHNSMRSYMGGYKVYILWAVDRLYHSAAPKLLKTLEEPDGQSLFILISEKPDQILSTILSRTQLVKIPRLTDEELMDALKAAEPDIDDQTIHDIAVISEGNYNKALQIYQDNAEQREMIDTFDTMMTSIMAFVHQRPLEEINYAQVQTLFGVIVKQGREKQKAFVELILRMLRNLLMQNTGSANLVKVTDQESGILSKFKNLNLVHITKMTEECNKALYHINRNGNTALIFTDLYFKLAGCVK